LGLPVFLVGVPRQLAGRVFRSKLFSPKNSQKDGFTLSGVEGQPLTIGITNLTLTAAGQVYDIRIFRFE